MREVAWIDTLLYWVRLATSLMLLTVCALLMLAVAVPTLFRMRRLYAEGLLTPFARLMLRVWGLRMIVHHDAPFGSAQTVYVMNHTSSIDMFAVVALGLPNTRFFLSGFLRKLLPLGLIGYLIGIFWTVDQAFSERRVRIFQRACRILRTTGESVCLSPEGERITGGRIGAFNKGAFHLAAALRAPMQPLFIQIPKQSDPGMGLRAHPGTLHVHVGKPIDTRLWCIEEVAQIKETVRDHYVRWKATLDG